MRALTGSDPKTSFTEVVDANSSTGSLDAIDRHNKILELQDFIHGNLLRAQESHARFYNSGRRAPNFAVGQKVMLRTANIRTLCPSKKLDVRFLGPLTILAKVNKNAYQLDIPTSRRIYNVFHVSLLSHYRGRMTGVEIETQSRPFCQDRDLGDLGRLGMRPQSKELEGTGSEVRCIGVCVWGSESRDCKDVC